MTDLTEKDTRDKVIDPALKREGWNDKYIKKEVNSLKSNFNTKKFEYGYKEGQEGRFIDYLLLDEHNAPLAIIEAKKFSLDPEKGIIQATSYQKDIEKQLGIEIPYFLTNGKKWFLKEHGYPRREVSGPFSQKDLKRRLDLMRRWEDLRNVKINPNIIDRSKSIEIVRRVLEHFNQGNRKALIHMATGTGKTRVAMALIDALIKSGHIQNVLFVVDRISLGRQAFGKGFQAFFSGTPATILNEYGFDPGKRLYVSTVQTLMHKNKGKGEYFQKFGPGFFDLIVFDEAHRSYYDRQNLVFQYFDGLKIGLTATPAHDEAKNTFEMFGCEDKEPTVAYTYSEAVEDGVLVPYEGQIIETKVLEQGIKGFELNKELRSALQKQEEDPDTFEAPGRQYARYFTDSKTNRLAVEEFMRRSYKTEDGRPCKTIFFCVNKDHAKEVEKVFIDHYPALASKDVSVVISGSDRVTDEMKRFEKEDSPRVVVSVDMFEAGVDVPEVCNIVFVRPVFSPIRFWQMLGRGTRNKEACKYPERLPLVNGIHDKPSFRILDFAFGDFSNIREHKLDYETSQKIHADVREKIFEKTLKVLQQDLTPTEKAIIETHVVDRVSKIDESSFVVRDKLDIVRKVKSKKFDLKDHIDQLKSEIVPLMKFSLYEDGRVQSFISRCIDLFMMVKEGDVEGIDKIREFVQERALNLWESNLEVVRRNDDLIKLVLAPKIWNELHFEDIDKLIMDLAPLMIYYQRDRRKRLRIDEADCVRNVEEFKMELQKNPKFEEFKNSPLVQKMQKEGVTWKELLEISAMLTKLNPQWSIEKVQRKMDFVLFLRRLLQFTEDLPDPETMIRWEFDKLIIAQNLEYTADQVHFLRILASYFAQQKHLDKSDLVHYPLSDERPLEKFKPEELEDVIKKAEGIKIR